MRKIIYTDREGNLCVVHPVRNTVGETLTDDEAIEMRAWSRLPSDAIDPRFVDGSAIPKDRTFRNAWVADGFKVAHDMGKCREIHKDRLRAMRAPKLAALDVAVMRADETGDTEGKASLLAQKRALRDATDDPSLLAAKTPEDLKNTIPEVLQ